MTKKKSSFWEYFRTFSITMFLMLVALVVVLNTAKHEAEYHINEDEKAIQDDMVGYLLSKYKYKEQTNPKDATVNLKLGQLYEMLHSYQQAQNNYIIAIEKRNGRYDTASYSLAGVYLLQKQYDKALAVITNLKDSPKYSDILQKGKFYKAYGDAMFNDNNFEKSVEMYDKSVYYLKKIKSTVIEEVDKARIDAYIALADEYVSQNKVQSAIKLLNKTLDYERHPLVLYKLGILYLDTAPETSIDLFEEVRKKDPSIINYEIYKRVLLALKVQFDYTGDLVKSRLYDAKLVRLKSYIQRNVLDAEELVFTDYKFKMKRFPVRNEYDVIYSFNLNNITNQDIPKMYAIIEFYDSKGKEIYEKIYKLPIKAGELNAGAEALPVDIVLKLKKDRIEKISDIDLKLYLSKNPKITRLLYAKNSIHLGNKKK